MTSTPPHPRRCLAPHPFVPAITCGLSAGHTGEHAGRAYWEPAGDDDGPATMRLPPVRDRVGILRRPPAPEVRELRGADLLRALAEQLANEDDEDQGDDDGAHS